MGVTGMGGLGRGRQAPSSTIAAEVGQKEPILQIRWRPGSATERWLNTRFAMLYTVPVVS